MNIVVTSQGVVMTVPAGAISADMDLTVDYPTQSIGGFPGALITTPTRILLHGTTQMLPSPAHLFLPYLDADHDGRVDGIAVDETTLSLWFSADGSGDWTPLPNAVVHPDSNMLEATITRLGVFGIFAATTPAFAVSLGEQSPRAEITVATSALPQSLPVLQARLDVGTEQVNVLEVTVVFSPALDGLPFLNHIQVQILHDTSGNGQRDASDAVLATSTLTGTMVTLPLSTPLTLAPMTTTYFLVTLGVATPGLGAHTATPIRTGWLLLTPVAFGLMLLPWHRRSPRWRRWGTLLLVCSMLCVSCDHGGDGDGMAEMVTLTLPTQGVQAEGVLSGPLSGPTAPLLSPNIVVVP